MDSRTAPPTAPGTYDLVEVAEAMRSLSLRVAEDPAQPLDRLVTIAVEASAEVGVNSALSQRLHHQRRGGVLAGLNI